MLKRYDNRYDYAAVKTGFIFVGVGHGILIKEKEKVVQTNRGDLCKCVKLIILFIINLLYRHMVVGIYLDSSEAIFHVSGLYSWSWQSSGFVLHFSTISLRLSCSVVHVRIEDSA